MAVEGRGVLTTRNRERKETMNEESYANLTPSQQAMLDLWQQHMLAEFVTKNVEEALATMTEDAHVLLVPPLTGGFGKSEVRKFYSESFIPQVPQDFEATMISQTIGQDRLVEEAVGSFTHTIAMDWILPGVPPTGKRVEIASVAIIQFRDGKISHEHLYWDQASALAQLGLLDAEPLPVAGALGARKLLETSRPAQHPTGESL
jgi:carboxymethylenebutenolidase